MALDAGKSAEGHPPHPGSSAWCWAWIAPSTMKTAAASCRELASRGRALEFARAFANRWIERPPTTLGYRVHRRPRASLPWSTHELPRTHVQRRRLCMPSTTDYVNDTDAQD